MILRLQLEDDNCRLELYEFMLKEWEGELKKRAHLEHFSAGLCYYLDIRFGIEYTGILPELHKAIKKAPKLKERPYFIAEMGELIPRIDLLKSVINTTKKLLILPTS